MHLTLFQDAYFDGTNIDFDIVIADSSGLVPQIGLVLGSGSDFTVTVYDSAGAVDNFTTAVTSTEIGTSGVYRIRTVYAELNRLALGGTAPDGIWRWVFTPTTARPDLTFEPLSVSITFNQEIGNATGTPTTTQATLQWLANTTDADHYKDSWISVKSGNREGECKKITASTTGGQLTFGAMSAALVAGDKVLIINR